eukprot:1079600-Prymnesium_polylepis.1
MMVKGNNHTIERNTIFETDANNFENNYDGVLNLGQRDMAVYSWDNFGTCQCTDTICIADYNETCCVPGDSNTWENINSDIYQNGMAGMIGTIGGTDAVPSTAAVDALFSVRRSENNSAGGLYEQLRDPTNLDFRPRAGSIWAQRHIGAYDAAGHGEVYWIPGRREWLASNPIPPDGATNVKPDADL